MPSRSAARCCGSGRPVVAAARPCALRRPATHHADLAGLRLRPWRTGRPLLHRGVPRPPPRRHPGPGARDRRRLLHPPLRRGPRDPADVLHVDPGAPEATFVGDLADGSMLPDAAFDCIVLTQTLHFIFDFVAALRTLARILVPGGVLLLTVPGISNIADDEWGATWHYSFTQHALRRGVRRRLRRLDSNRVARQRAGRRRLPARPRLPGADGGRARRAARRVQHRPTVRVCSRPA